MKLLSLNPRFSMVQDDICIREEISVRQSVEFPLVYHIPLETQTADGASL